MWPVGLPGGYFPDDLGLLLAQAENLELLRWAIEEGLQIYDASLVSTVRIRISSSYVSLIPQLFIVFSSSSTSLLTRPLSPSKFLLKVIRQGDPNLAEWLLLRKDIPRNTEIYVAAAEKNNLKLINIMRGYKDELLVPALAAAIEHGHLTLAREVRMS